MSATATSDALPGERLLSVPEAARILEVSPATLRGWIREGTIPAYRTGRTRLWLRREDVERRWRDRVGDNAARKMTPEQQELLDRAMEEAWRLQDRLLAERGGKLFPNSSDELHEIREERARQLS